MRFPSLDLPTPTAAEPARLKAAAQRASGEGAGLLLQDARPRPVRDVDTLMNLVWQGGYFQLRPIEWLLLVKYKHGWDERFPGLAEKTSCLIWEAAVKQVGVRRLLWRKLALLRATGQGGLSPSIAGTFPHFEALTAGTFSLPCRLLQALSAGQGAAQALLEISQAQRIPPPVLMRSFDLPGSLPPVRDALKQAVVDWLARRSHPVGKGGEWLVACLEAMTREEQVRAVEVVGKKMSREEATTHPALMAWVKARFSRRSEDDSLWAHLTVEGRRALREWVGAVNYRTFERLIEDLLGVPSSRELFQAHEINQLEKRRWFWRNYSDRFAQLRILLSETAVTAARRGIVDGRDVAVLDARDMQPGLEKTQATEVCIFDFDEMLVIEFFRGPGSETMLIPATDVCRAYLFNAETLSVKRLRAFGYLHAADILDHKYRWQTESVRFLIKRKIYPNKGLTSFRVDAKFNHPYSPVNGIGVILPEAAEERRKSLQNWSREVEQLKREALLAYPSLESLYESFSVVSVQAPVPPTPSDTGPMPPPRGHWIRLGAINRARKANGS